jgi:putative DNA primase/helicase
MDLDSLVQAHGSREVSDAINNPNEGENAMLNELQATLSLPATHEALMLEAAPRYREYVSEDEAGRAFARAYAGQLRFDERRGSWFAWSGSHWKVAGNLAITEIVRNFVRMEAGHTSGKAKEAMGRAGYAEKVERVVKTNSAILVDAGKWDADPFKLGTPSGTVDLKSGMVMPPDHADLITKTTRVSPARNEDCARWHQFLVEATRDDAELIRFLKQFCGYSLTGVIRDHALALICGPGGNGKSVFANVVGAILKDYAVVAPMETFTATKSPRHETEMAMLAGSRLVRASETERGRAWNETRIKSVTGGDPQTARFMRQDHFTFEPTFKLLVIGNHKPVLREVSDAIKRRMRIVEFKYKPISEDATLEPKLLAEAPGILRWMINGALDWQDSGKLMVPESVRRATENYLAEHDTASQWMDECCEFDAGYRTPISEIRASWEEYAKAEGIEPFAITDNLNERGCSSKKSNGKRFYNGVRLKSQN